MKRFEQGMYKAPVYLGVFVNKNVKALRDERYNELEFYWALESAAMAIENLMLKAVELGLGTCYIGVACFEYIEKKLKRMAGLSEEYYLTGLISIGYPQEKPKPKKRKKRTEKLCRNVFKLPIFSIFR